MAASAPVFLHQARTPACLPARLPTPAPSPASPAPAGTRWQGHPEATDGATGRSVATAFMGHAADKIALGVQVGKLPPMANEWMGQQVRLARCCAALPRQAAVPAAVPAPQPRRAAHPAPTRPSCAPRQVGRQLASYRQYSDAQLQASYEQLGTFLRAFMTEGAAAGS